VKARGKDNPRDDWRAELFAKIAAGRLKTITDPGFRDEVARSRGIGLDLFSQLPDKYPQIFGLFGAIGAPYGRKKRAM
jgi:hypothetical protein